MQYLTNIDLNKNELQNARVQNLATAPANPVPGQIYYNSTSNTYMGWNGTTWIDMSVVFSNKAILDAISAAFTTALKTKLDGIATNANNYVHPASHSADMITETTLRRFVADTKISEWDGKETTTGSQTKATAAQTAAQTYADNKIAALLASAPATLDTLKELADALGNDANFATTMTNNLALKTDKFAQTIGNGTATTFTLAHGLASTDVVILVKEVASGNTIMCDSKSVDTNNVMISFATAPATSQYRVVIIG